MLQYLFGLLPVAAACGWYFGKVKSKNDSAARISFKMRRDYFKGLNYLINEQPDKAVDVFIKLLEVDSDTVETHLALGSLFRRRGEVERAIRIHQNIIARPNLAPGHRLQALSELGQDYLGAGVLDRAERLFLEIIDLGEQSQSSYRFLLHIYQLEKDWKKAIKISQNLQNLGEPMGLDIAHYYCEIAEAMLSESKHSEAQVQLKKAQSYQSSCARVSMIWAQLEYDNGNYKGAIHYFRKLASQDAAYLSEALPVLIDCYQKLQQEEKMVEFLRGCLLKQPCMSLVLAIADHLQKTADAVNATDFMVQQIDKQPTLWGLKHLVERYIGQVDYSDRERFSRVYNLLERLLLDQPIYRCVQCGFSSKSLFWLCPSCHHWSTVKPIQALPSKSDAKTNEK